MDSNTVGEFSFNTGDELKKFRGQILAFKTTSMAPLPGMPPIPRTPIYRSAVFKFADILSWEQSATKKIFIFEAVTHNDNGISQDELDDEVANLRTKFSQSLTKLSATILSDRVSTAEERGGCIKFNAYVRGATSEDLGRVIDVKAGGN